MMVLLTAAPALFEVIMWATSPAPWSSDNLSVLSLFVVPFAASVMSLFMRETLELNLREVVLAHPPFVIRRIPLTNIHRLELRDYPSPREQWPFRKLRVFSSERTAGVELQLSAGADEFIGSEDPAALADAIASAAPHVVVLSADERPNKRLHQTMRARKVPSDG